jgi:hypothetical protein
MLESSNKNKTSKCAHTLLTNKRFYNYVMSSVTVIDITVPLGSNLRPRSGTAQKVAYLIVLGTFAMACLVSNQCGWPEKAATSWRSVSLSLSTASCAFPHRHDCHHVLASRWSFCAAHTSTRGICTSRASVWCALRFGGGYVARYTRRVSTRVAPPWLQVSVLQIIAFSLKGWDFFLLIAIVALVLVLAMV